MFKGIVFDMDGVLINSEIYYFNSLVELIESDGNKVNREDFKRIVGLSGNDSKNIISQYYLEDFHYEDFMSRYKLTYLGDKIDYSKLLFPYVKETLNSLKQKGLKIGLASSSHLSTIKRVLKECNLEGFFDYIIGGDQVKNPKPDSEIYLKAAAGLGLKVSDCIAVEDSFAGIKSAKNAGLYVIAKRGYEFSMDQSLSDIILENMELIPTIVDILMNNSTEYKYSSMDYGSKLYLKSLFIQRQIQGEESKTNFKEISQEDNVFRLALEDGDNLVGFLEIDLNSKEDKWKIVINPSYSSNIAERELMDSLNRIKK